MRGFAKLAFPSRPQIFVRLSRRGRAEIPLV
jgi:hypothetical protein